MKTEDEQNLKIRGYKRLLEIIGVDIPQVLMENPELLLTSEATESDIKWAVDAIYNYQKSKHKHFWSSNGGIQECLFCGATRQSPN